MRLVRKASGWPSRVFADVWDFLETFAVPVPESGCWLWDTEDSEPYGRIMLDGVRTKAHRVAYSLAYGPIPQGMVICHKCDVPGCVNPRHLFAGTHLDNKIDSVTKGRASGARGAGHPRAKLSDAQVSAVRNDPRPAAKVAAEFGVSESCIRHIRRGRARRLGLDGWKDRKRMRGLT